MMNGSHAATALLVGVAATGLAAPATGVAAEPVTYLLGGFVAAGAGLLPDIDHDRSTITRSGGVVTRGLAEALQWLARRTYAATRTKHDPDSDGEHRGLIHTPAFAIATGIGVAVGTALSPWVGLAVAWLLLAAAIRSLRWSLPRRLCFGFKLHHNVAAPVYALAAVVGLVHLGALDDTGPFLGILVSLGMITHSLGDGLTDSGIPFTWPVRLPCTRNGCRSRCRGQRWRRLGVLPTSLRFTTGAAVERVIEVVSLLAASGLFALQVI